MSQLNRRSFLRMTGAAGATAAMWGGTQRVAAAAEKPPNVILIITDDQGYGDIGRHGNPYLKTPNLDRLHDEGVRFEHFYSCPVCSPTRACLMTGRYNYRTGVVDTFVGRSMMYPEELTLAEALGQAGYATGIFGKWHLGDNYPLRAMDQGFQESLVLRGGGLCQPSDWPGNTYFDPILSHNGAPEKTQGYCTDVYTNAALRFIEANRERPFFVYLPTNAPHVPLQIDDRYAAPYLAQGLDEDTARVYGMVANIDENVGRVLDALTTLGLAENTLVIFMTDNGPQAHKDGVRYNAGMRGAKGTVYEGGIRVPFFIRWPAKFPSGRVVRTLGAHIDVFPTLLSCCGITRSKSAAMDGMDLLPWLTGAREEVADRTLFFQWHRGDAPEAFRDCAVRTTRYKLVNGKELYDLVADPAEAHDIAGDHPAVVSDLRARYEAWFADVSATRGYAPPRIQIGTPHENPVVLTRQDWHGAPGYSDANLGWWEVHVSRPGAYEVTVTFPEIDAASELTFTLGEAKHTAPLKKGAQSCQFRLSEVREGNAQLSTSFMKDGKSAGVTFVEIRGPLAA